MCDSGWILPLKMVSLGCFVVALVCPQTRQFAMTGVVLWVEYSFQAGEFFEGVVCVGLVN